MICLLINCINEFRGQKCLKLRAGFVSNKFQTIVLYIHSWKIQRWTEPTIIKKIPAVSWLHERRKAPSTVNPRKRIILNPNKNKLSSSFRTKSRKECHLLPPAKKKAVTALKAHSTVFLSSPTCYTDKSIKIIWLLWWALANLTINLFARNSSQSYRFWEREALARYIKFSVRRTDISMRWRKCQNQCIFVVT